MRRQRDVVDPSSNQGQEGSNTPTTPNPSDVPTTTPGNNGPPRNYNPPEMVGDNSTDTIAAITVALLAVLIIISVLLIFRAIRKRRRALRGTELNAIPTITTGVMGTGVSAYGNINVAGPISWESVNNVPNNDNRNRNEAQGAMAMAAPSQYDNGGFTRNEAQGAMAMAAPSHYDNGGFT
ncbi:uncharacterized protein LOC110443771 [Mizuhopecten yessoensis]|uniref:Uncharacterized protein n=1 Tax=Mizuhopecten yessoensis TaxID=6573 RepID=A0A210PE34_MIZYE|nr:uncharacterized protein LOC110443771 [Mizuhopecten yessoensis]XP_021343851.1 uncharacterized protein LOC110443771 [Mizuhopecten yessoensis]OWF34760.1 hypothetical protein KP79_PYT14158 [Mizuhopecten yessoensis]